MILAPNARTPINNTAFTFYAMRQQQIEDVINLLVITDNPNDFETQREVYEAVGINSDSFTSDEIKYIEYQITKRWRY